jgi:hypothetical protein
MNRSTPHLVRVALTPVGMLLGIACSAHAQDIPTAVAPRAVHAMVTELVRSAPGFDAGRSSILVSLGPLSDVSGDDAAMLKSAAGPAARAVTPRDLPLASCDKTGVATPSAACHTRDRAALIEFDGLTSTRDSIVVHAQLSWTVCESGPSCTPHVATEGAVVLFHLAAGVLGEQTFFVEMPDPSVKKP